MLGTTNIKFWIHETGTGQQVAQLHEIYDDDDDDDDDDDFMKVKRVIPIPALFSFLVNENSKA